MGTTKFICYCRPPFRYCKSGVTPEGSSCFETDYWAEVRSNIERYLAEDICVPGAGTVERVHRKLHEILVGYLDQLGAVRALQGASLARSAEALVALNNVNASILAYGADLVAGKDLQLGELVSFDIPQVVRDDACLNMARLLVVAAHRAAHELIESISSNNQLYIFHHHAVFYDISQHMTRLISEAWVANSEALLDEDHPHAVSVREMHASEQVRA